MGAGEVARGGAATEREEGEGEELAHLSEMGLEKC
jgi:hypothetical protein